MRILLQVFQFLKLPLRNLIWPANTSWFRADVGVANKYKPKGLKIPRVSLTVCRVHVLRLLQWFLLCWFWPHSKRAPPPPQCLIERCICWGALVASKWRTAFVCGTGKEMVRTGPGALICLWQTDGLAWWLLLPDGWLSPDWHCNVCSHCQLLLKVIYALKIHPALIEAPNRKIPSSTERRIQFFPYIDLLFTGISGLFFFFLPLHFFTRTCLKLLWFRSAPRLQWNSWRAPDLLMFHVPEVTLTCMSFVGWRGSLPRKRKN